MYTLSLNLFNLVIHTLTTDIHDVLWCMLFTNDVVLTGEIRKQDDDKLWRRT